MVVRREVHRARSGVVLEGEGHAVLRPDLVPDDDLVDVVELVPVLLVPVHVAEKGLELGTPRHRDVESLRREEGLLIEEVPVVPAVGGEGGECV